MNEKFYPRPVRAALRSTALAFVALTVVLAGTLAGAQAAHAGESRRMPRDVPTAYVKECGSCHVAYPPALLPARSWQRVMNGLDEHYGSDASLDAQTTQQLSRWLTAYAGTYKRVREEPPEDRLTRSAWFERKHDEIAPRVWALPSVKSPANCSACHTDAERGGFDDHDLRIPAGLDARSRRAWH